MPTKKNTSKTKNKTVKKAKRTKEEVRKEVKERVEKSTPVVSEIKKEEKVLVQEEPQDIPKQETEVEQSKPAPQVEEATEASVKPEVVKEKLIKTPSGSYVPESMVVQTPIEPVDGGVSITPKNPETTVATTPTTSVQTPIAVEQVTVTQQPKKVVELSDLDDNEIEVPLEKSNKRIYFIGLFIVIFIFLTAVGVFFFRTKLPHEKNDKVVTEISQDEEVYKDEEDESQDDQVDNQLERKDIKIEILNASGVSGLAGDTAEKFEDLGYQDINLGNSSVKDGNELYINKEYEDKIEVLLSDCEDLLEISSVSGELEDSDLTARIILGR